MFKLLISLLMLLFFLSGCSGVQTFPNMARAGDTVSVGMGWQKQFKRSNTTVTITPSVGDPIVYLPGDPAVRAIINLYPDPVSYLVVGTDTQTNESYKSGYTYGTIINGTFTDGDHDWWQTTAFVDLPDFIPPGQTTVQFTNDSGESTSSVVEVISGVGQADAFNANGNGPLDSNQLESMERASYFEVSFNGVEIPYAIELEFTYAGDLHVINPRASMKNVIWSGDGSLLKVMLLPAQGDALTNFHDFKFYIAGQGALQVIQDIQSLQLQSMQAFNINGESMTGVNAAIVANIE